MIHTMFLMRITVPINQVEHVVVGKDHYDGTPCKRYVKCANPECNLHVLTSEENEAKHLGACTLECAKHGLSEEHVAKVLAELEVVQWK